MSELEKEMLEIIEDLYSLMHLMFHYLRGGKEVDELTTDYAMTSEEVRRFLARFEEVEE
jgi:hypothetical protein